MSKNESPTIIIVRETVWESIISDTYTFSGMILSCLVGWWLDIPALSWIAGLFLVIAIIARSVNGFKNHYTVAQARAKLDEIEAKINAA